MTTPRFSVVLICLRKTELAALTLQTVMWQGFRDFELLVYEDGDNPSLRSIVHNIRLSVPSLRTRVRYFESAFDETRPGTYGNPFRRDSLDRVLGRHVIWLTPGCLMSPGCLQLHADALNLKPGAVSLVNFDYCQNGFYVGKGPRCWQRYENMRPESLSLASMAWPLKTTIESNIFPKSVDNREDNWHENFTLVREAVGFIHTPHTGIIVAEGDL
jgi:glycosyltransferase involved in cell wall biosynthesis